MSLPDSDDYQATRHAPHQNGGETRLFDPWYADYLLSEEFDQQPDSGNARALRDDQHAQRYGWQRVVGQDRLKPPFTQKIIDKPMMCGCNAAPGDEGLACGEPMIDAKSSSDGHRMARPVVPMQDKGIAPRNVRHADTLMTGQILRNSRPPSRCQIVRGRHKQTP